MMQTSAIKTIDKFRLDDKVSIVTGASRGIGLAMAEGLAGAGSNLLIVGRRLEPLQSIAERIANESGRQVIPIEADVGNFDDIGRIVEQTMDQFGRIDVLVNNAGINVRRPAEEYTEADWDTVTDVNLKGTFFLTQACGKVMIQQNAGKIINNLSLASAIGLPTITAYAASKGGLMQITKLLAVEWARHNIQVNGIAPGFIRTALTEPMREDSRNRWVLNRTPANRWGEPEDLVGLTIYLASEVSNFVTGEVIFVDGGCMAGSDWRYQA
ncbi:MAG: glucose 1-dehydrogenase [Candidatus Poribacteria bacterium]|nr:glucose 1-dehydrogenase [Candidatus Poribacteria bacterium]